MSLKTDIQCRKVGTDKLITRMVEREDEAYEVAAGRVTDWLVSKGIRIEKKEVLACMKGERK